MKELPGGWQALLLQESVGKEESDHNDKSKSFISVENGVAGSLPLTAANRCRVGNEPRRAQR